MNGNVQLDPAGLRHRSARLATLGERMNRTYAELRNGLAQADGSWGDDYMGRAFAENFEPHADQLLADVRSMADSLRDTAVGISDVVNRFEVQDRDNAARIGPVTETADPNAGNPNRWGWSGAGTPRLGGEQLPLSSGLTETAPATSGSTPWLSSDPASRERLTDSPTARTRKPSDAERPTSADRPSRRDQPERTGRERGGDSGARAASPAPRQPVPGVLPPATTREAPGAPGVPSDRRSAVSGGRRDTPWSGSPDRPPGPTAAPDQGSPPARLRRPDKRSNEKPRDRDRLGRDVRPVSDPVVTWLARNVAERHGVQVVGFETPGLPAPVVREFVGAVDQVLTGYPAITLDVVAVAELTGCPSNVQWSCEPHGLRGTTRSIALDQRHARRPAPVTGTAESAVEPRRLEIYSATLREFGRALDDVGGGLAGKQAQRILIAEYLRHEPAQQRTLGEVVHGYLRWRTEVIGCAADAAGFVVNGIVGAAFAQVVQHGDEADGWAKAVHSVLVAAATGPA